MAWILPGLYYFTVSRDLAFCALFSTDIRSSLPPAHGWLRKFPRSVSYAENHDDPQQTTHRKKADGDIFCCHGFQIIKIMKLFMLLDFFKCHWNVPSVVAKTVCCPRTDHRADPSAVLPCSVRQWPAPAGLFCRPVALFAH